MEMCRLFMRSDKIDLLEPPHPNPLPKSTGGERIEWVNSPLQSTRGFTLIEVLLALAIIAIAFAALLKASSQNIQNTQRLKEKTISHWVALQGIQLIQLGIVQPTPQQDMTEITTLLGQRWYWRIHISPTPFKKVEQITITLSQKQSGPFRDAVIGYRYHDAQ